MATAIQSIPTRTTAMDDQQYHQGTTTFAASLSSSSSSSLGDSLGGNYVHFMLEPNASSQENLIPNSVFHGGSHNEQGPMFSEASSSTPSVESIVISHSAPQDEMKPHMTPHGGTESDGGTALIPILSPRSTEKPKTVGHIGIFPTPRQPITSIHPSLLNPDPTQLQPTQTATITSTTTTTQSPKQQQQIQVGSPLPHISPPMSSDLSTQRGETCTALAPAPAGSPTANQHYLDITPYLDIPQSEAAKRLGIPTSTLSKRWREAVRSRKWPFRAIRSIDKQIMTLLHNVPQGGNQPLPSEIEAELGILLRKRQEELRPVVVRL